MRFVRRDPDCGYLDSDLWAPKSAVNVESVRNALSFLLTDKRGSTRYLHLYRETEHHIIVPRAMWNVCDLTFPVKDVRPQTFQRTGVVSKITLDAKNPSKTTQKDAVRAILEERGGILQLACGKGKSVIALEVIARLDVPALIVVNNTSLMDQWSKEIQRHLSVPGGVGLIQGTDCDWKKSVVLSTYQTLANRADTLPGEIRKWFGLGIYDEGHHCFPAGTLVDGKRIETITAGTIIRSFNHTTGEIELVRVTSTMQSPVGKLVRIQTRGGLTLTCTCDHPIFTTEGYKHASNIQAQDRIGVADSPVQLVRNVIPLGEENTSRQYTRGEARLLLRRTRACCTSGRIIENNGEDKQETRLYSNESSESYEERTGTRKSVTHPKSARVLPKNTRGQWQTIERTTSNSTEEVGVGSRVSSKNERKERERLPVLLPNRPCRTDKESSCGSGRAIALNAACESLGREKNSVLTFDRVDRVEILQPGGDGTYGTLCANGLVYNLEVEGNHNYFANGILVHNCAAPWFCKSIDLVYGMRLLLTATPERTDGAHVVYNFHAGKVIYKDLKQDLTPTFQFLWTGLTLDAADEQVAKAVTDRKGELHLSKLAGYFGTWLERLNFIINLVRKHEAAGRKTLVLSNSVAELVNLLILYNGGTELYKKQSEAVPLPSRTRKLKESELKKARAMLYDKGMNPVKRERIATVILPNLEATLLADDDARRAVTAQEKENRNMIRRVIQTQSNAGLMVAHVPIKQRMEALKKCQTTFAIYQYGIEGLDEADLDTVIAAEPMTSKNAIQQFVGRTLRVGNKIGKKPLVQFVEDNIGPIIGMCKAVRKHLREWPADEGGPYRYELIGHPGWDAPTTRKLIKPHR